MIVKLGSKASMGEVAHFLASVPEALFPVLLPLPGREQNLPANLSFSFFKASVPQFLLKPDVIQMSWSPQCCMPEQRQICVSCVAGVVTPVMDSVYSKCMGIKHHYP